MCRTYGAQDRRVSGTQPANIRRAGLSSDAPMALIGRAGRAGCTLGQYVSRLARPRVVGNFRAEETGGNCKIETSAARSGVVRYLVVAVAARVARKRTGLAVPRGAEWCGPILDS